MSARSLLSDCLLPSWLPNWFFVVLSVCSCWTASSILSLWMRHDFLPSYHDLKGLDLAVYQYFALLSLHQVRKLKLEQFCHVSYFYDSVLACTHTHTHTHTYREREGESHTEDAHLNSLPLRSGQNLGAWKHTQKKNCMGTSAFKNDLSRIHWAHSKTCQYVHVGCGWLCWSSPQSFVAQLPWSCMWWTLHPT